MTCCTSIFFSCISHLYPLGINTSFQGKNDIILLPTEEYSMVDRNLLLLLVLRSLFKLYKLFITLHKCLGLLPNLGKSQHLFHVCAVRFQRHYVSGFLVWTNFKSSLGSQHTLASMSLIFWLQWHMSLIIFDNVRKCVKSTEI